MNLAYAEPLISESDHVHSLAWPIKQGNDHRPNILIAEDNPDLLEVLGIFLSLAGFAPVGCCDGQIASAKFRTDTRFALLITDLEMPGKSGLELARELTALQGGLPVLIISGAIITDEMSAEMKARKWVFLAKPYVFPVLLGNVETLIGSCHRGGSAEAGTPSAARLSGAPSLSLL